MRIKLIVQRHSLPPANVLWTVGVPQPPHSPGGASVTVSQFLEQVNDIIPLESEEWGLEDYAVEVGGFECLHFSELTQILKEDDEVSIRPLQASDLRFRRISGRHQITADGRHLIDGVAFGRPFLRRTERPAIKIPPRKRRRVLYDTPEDDNNEAIFDDQQIIVHAGPDDAGIAPAESEDDSADEDFVALGKEEEDLSAELEDIHRDLQVQLGQDTIEANGPTGGHVGSRPRRSTRTQAPREGLGLRGSELLKLRDENGRPYPVGYDNPLLEIYSQDAPLQPDMNARKRKRNSDRSRENGHHNTGISIKGSVATPISNRKESSASLKSVRFEDDAVTTPPTTILDGEDNEDTEDEDFEPPPDAKDDTDESDKENAEPKVDEDVSSEIMSSESESSSSSSESDATSSSGSSSTSSSEAETETQHRSTSTSKTTARASVNSSARSSSGNSLVTRDGNTSEMSTGADRSDRRKDSVPQQTKQMSQIGEDEPASIVLPARLYKKIREMKEPERCHKWLKGVLEGDPSHQVVQSTLYHAYRAQFVNDCKDGRSLVEAETLIKSVQTLFQGARTEFLSTPHAKYIIRGVRARNHCINSSAKTVPPGKGKISTRKRNERRKLAKGAKWLEKLKSSQEATELRTENTSKDGAAPREHSIDIHKTRGKVLTASATDLEFIARRQALLDSIASGGVEFGADEPSPDASASNRPAPTTHELSANDITANKIDASRAASGQDNTPFEPTLAQEASEGELLSTSRAVVNEKQNQPSRPRSKIDLASSRRLLFGALGLRAPKTKEDEQALQAKLMRDVRPSSQAQNSENVPQVPTKVSSVDDESWRSKIDLRAVECCYEGIELSTPPFPFVQRWDPQQQRGYRNGKGKKRKRNNQRYYYDAIEDQEILPARKRGKSASPSGDVHMAEMEGQGMPSLDAQPTSSDSNQGAVNEQLLRESQEAAVSAQKDDCFQEDLPPLPYDMDACKALTLEIAKPGMVIAFKKLDMSVETNWQPRISEYRTAIVDECKEDGTLYMTLAFRDRSNKGAAYDPETGERLYHKFEMPGYGNEDDEEAEGHLELPLAELIEPKIVQAVESQAEENGNRHLHEAGEVTSAVIDQAEPPEDADKGDFDETWEGFEESRTIDQLDGANNAKDADESQEPEHMDSVAGENESRHDRSDDRVDEVKTLAEIQSPAVEDSDDVAYPNLGNRLKELVKTDIEEGQSSVADVDVSDPTLTATAKPSQVTTTMSDARDQLRQEISDLIKDAGWRSSIHVPANGRPSPQQEPRAMRQESVEINVQSSNPPSPKFNGFDHRTTLEDASEALPAEIPETYQEPLEVADSLPAQVTDQDELLNEYPMEDYIVGNNAIQPDHDIDGAQASEQTASKLVGSSVSPLSPGFAKSESQSRAGASQEHRSISPPQRSKAKPKPALSGTNNRVSKSPPKASNPRTKVRNSGPQAKLNGKNDYSSTVSNSEDDLPDLEKVFASRISSLQPPSSQSSTNLTIKPEDSQINLQALPAHNSFQRPLRSRPARSTKSSSVTSPLPTLSSFDENDSNDHGFSSQWPQGTPIVDLTLSSDPVESSGSAYEEDSSLPNGPGWISKLRSSQRARSVGKGTERRGNGVVALVGR